MTRFVPIMLPLVVLASLLTHGQVAAAEDAATCDSTTGADAIAACSRLIASGREKGGDLAKLYRNRCGAWNRDHEPDRAIADCSEAIRLDAGAVAAAAVAATATGSCATTTERLRSTTRLFASTPKTPPPWAAVARLGQTKTS